MFVDERTVSKEVRRLFLEVARKVPGVLFGVYALDTHAPGVRVSEEGVPFVQFERCLVELCKEMLDFLRVLT